MKDMVFAIICAVMLCIVAALSMYPYKKDSRYSEGECLIRADKDGGYYKVLKVTDYSYIMRGFGKYVRSNSGFPVVVPRERPLLRIDCFEGEFEKEYRKYVLKKSRK